MLGRGVDAEESVWDEQASGYVPDKGRDSLEAAKVAMVQPWEEEGSQASCPYSANVGGLVSG